MALFDKKSDSGKEEAGSEVKPRMEVEVSRGRTALIIPRVSEKSGALNKLNKYVFKITGKMNKVEVKRAIENTYKVKVTGVNMVTMKARSRNFGRTAGKTSAFKKAIVTLAKGNSIESAKES